MPCSYAWCSALARVHGYCKHHWFMIPAELRDEIVISNGLMARRTVATKLETFWRSQARSNN